MNIRFLFLLTFLLSAILGQSASAQRVAIQVSTIIHEDNSKTLSTRDFKKRTMEQRTYSPRGVMQMKRQFVMDREGRVKSGVAFDGSDQLIFTFRYKFDDLDRLDEEKIFDRAGNVVRRLKTTYDELGKATRTARTDVKGSVLSKLDDKMFEHPERLETRGTKLQGNQLNRSGTRGKPLKR